MIRNTPFATKLTRALAKRLPNLSPLRPLLHAVDRLPGRGKRWLLVVLERNGG
jgi:hypothetical protein